MVKGPTEHRFAPVVVEELFSVDPDEEWAALHSERRAQAYAAKTWWERIEILMIFLEGAGRSDLFQLWLRQVLQQVWRQLYLHASPPWQLSVRWYGRNPADRCSCCRSGVACFPVISSY